MTLVNIVVKYFKNDMLLDIVKYEMNYELKQL